MEGHAYYSNSPWTWREKLTFKLFPVNPCMWPEAPANFKGALACNTNVHLNFLDRIRVLFTGRLVVETRTVTENEIGDNVTSSSVYSQLYVRKRS
jgi:hypothetical protein